MGNMEPENGPLEERIAFGNHHFRGNTYIEFFFPENIIQGIYRL